MFDIIKKWLSIKKKNKKYSSAAFASEVQLIGKDGDVVATIDEGIIERYDGKGKNCQKKK